ncbi:hypothetical protein KC338_g7025 [Hortaea werneckii]|nr:hypothetical protein KC338_g7025 [Hortaea werneckii]
MEPQMQAAAPGQPWIPEAQDFGGATVAPFMAFESPDGLSGMDFSGDGMNEPYLPDFSQPISGVDNFDNTAAWASLLSSGPDLSGDGTGDEWTERFLAEDFSGPEDLNNAAEDPILQSSPVNGGEIVGAPSTIAMPSIPHDLAAEGFNIPVSNGNGGSSGHETSPAGSIAVPNDVQPTGVVGSGQIIARSPKKIARRTRTPQPASPPKYGPGNPRPNNRVGQTRNWSQALRQHRRRCEETVGCQEDCMVKKEFPEKWAEQNATVCKGWVGGKKEKGEEVTTNELWAWKYDAKPVRNAAPARRRAKAAL